MSETNPSAAYENLRRETATLLGYNLAGDLPLTQSLQLDLVSLLRLEVDGLQGRVLAGQEVDLDRLAAALGMLQKLLPPAELKVDPPQVGRPAAGSARERLKALIEATTAARVEDEATQVQELQAEVEKLRSELEAARAGAARPPAAEPVPPDAAAPAAPSTVVPLRQPEPPRQAQPPAHYLRDHQVQDPGVAFYRGTSHWARRDWSPPRNW